MNNNNIYADLRVGSSNGTVGGMPVPVNEKTRPLEYAVNELQIVVGQIDNGLGRLLGRLSPLIPAVPQEGNSKQLVEVSNGSSQLVRSIINQIDRLKNIRDVIGIQTDLIEL